MTAKAGLALTGWGQGACAGDYDNDGHEDLFVSFWGQSRLFRNKGDGTFEETTNRAGMESARKRWGAGCAFLDYNRDGRLDLFVANYIDLDLSTAPVPESGLCRYKGVPVACGPPGLPGAQEHPLSQRWGRPVQRRVRAVGDYPRHRYVCARRQHG